MGGAKNISQVNHPQLRQELADILVTRQKHCLIAIPDMNPESPKWWFWKKYVDAYPKMLDHKIIYYSQFITRPDSAPKIDVPEFYDRMEQLWAGKRVILVRGSTRSLVEETGPLASAARTFPVLCARRDAYAEIDSVERRVLELITQHGGMPVLLCAGAMATVLAYRLSKKEIHAVDLGHIGYLWRYYARASKHPKA